MLTRAWISVPISLVMACTTFVTPANAANTVKPKVGQCFMYTNADVSAPYATKNPVSCSKSHNAETFLVAKWPLTTRPENLPEGDGLEIATGFCHSFAATGGLFSSHFNYWAWYTPSPAAWAKGERWLRCDGMKKDLSIKSEPFISWKGQKLNFKRV